MPLFLDCEFDADGMIRALNTATGYEFQFHSGSSETLCTFDCVMPLHMARAIEAYLHRLPKDKYFTHDFETRVELVESSPSRPRTAASIVAQKHQRPEEDTRLARLSFTLGAPFTVDVRDLAKQCRFDASYYHHITSTPWPGDAQGQSR